MPRGPYNRISPTDRSRIVRAANDGGNWRQLAEQLGVNHSTAYTWIREGRDEPKKKGGRQRKCTNAQIDVLVDMIERDPTLTLRQLSGRTLPEFGVHVGPSTIHNYLEGRLITLKKAHAIPATMNTDANKELRRQYVQRVSQCMRDGKTIIWMDETNLNLFCRRSQGRARIGERAVMALPTSKGPNIHVICALSAYQMIYMTRRRGAFKSDIAKAWLLEMLDNLPPGITVDTVVVVCDNAPCHSKFEECLIDKPGLTICRLGPYSPMLNPVETIWSKMKAEVKQRMRVPQVRPPGVGEQRLQYVEALIDDAMGRITVQDIVNSCQHSQGFFQRALNLEDMNVGA